MIFFNRDEQTCHSFNSESKTKSYKEFNGVQWAVPEHQVYLQMNFEAEFDTDSGSTCSVYWHKAQWMGNIISKWSAFWVSSATVGREVCFKNNMLGNYILKRHSVLKIWGYDPGHLTSTPGSGCDFLYNHRKPLNSQAGLDIPCFSLAYPNPALFGLGTILPSVLYLPSACTEATRGLLILSQALECFSRNHVQDVHSVIHSSLWLT